MATTRTASASRRATGRRPAAVRDAAQLVYVYCIVQSDAPPAPGRVRGLPDAGPPRAAPLGRSRWLLLADVPARRFGAAALSAGLHDLDWVGACALAHDALVMDAMKNGPVVPMRLFTIFENESRARTQARLASRQIARTLRRVAGRAEYGVRIGAMTPARRAATAPAPRLTGRSFLEHKRQQLKAQLTRGAVSDTERRQVFERLARLSDEARARPIPEGGSVWLDGAFLVAFGRAAAFRREARRLTAELTPEGHEVVLTGPWPPYSFLDEHGAKG